MIREAKFNCQCSECGGKIEAGEEIEYLPPTGDLPALTSHHPECPERKPRKVRGVHHAQRVDVEDAGLMIERRCQGETCGRPWFVKRTSPAARQSVFLGHCCSGDEQLYGRKADERHLKAVA
jgi:hypothetical protein